MTPDVTMNTDRWHAFVNNLVSIPPTTFSAAETLEVSRHPQPQEGTMSNAALHTDLDIIERGLRQVGFLYQADIIVLANQRIRELQSEVDHINEPHEDDHEEAVQARRKARQGHS